MLGGAGALVYTDNLLAAAPVGLLGLLLLFQVYHNLFICTQSHLNLSKTRLFMKEVKSKI